MFMSFFVHRNSDMLPIGQRYRFDDLRSHPAVASRYEWVEVEWTGEDEVSLEVRDERRDVLKAILLADFPTRAEALAYAVQHLPDGLTTLDLGGATLPAGIKFPDGLTTLHLGGATVPAGIKFPAGLTWLDLGYAKLPAEPGGELGPLRQCYAAKAEGAGPRLRDAACGDRVSRRADVAEP